MRKSQYRRILLKLSGESLMGRQGFGIGLEACLQLAEQIREVRDLGVQIGIVIGGGNIFRGQLATEFGFARTPADHIGMLATAINGMVLQQALVKVGCDCQVVSAFDTDSMIELYVWQNVLKDLEQGRIVVFVGGTGNPYFTTDTAAALRASEIDADVLIKATKVDGIYDQDPIQHPSARHFPNLTYSEVFSRNLNVMDATAIALCRDNQIPIHVLNIFKKGSLLTAICEKTGGTLVEGG